MSYQLLHPWHWLTYGQNATAFAALVALAGLVGLYFYTRYTRRMMQVQEATARASIRPILVAQGIGGADLEFSPLRTNWLPGSDALIGRGPREIAEYKTSLSIRNVGAGAALLLTGWHQKISEKFTDEPQRILNKTAQAKDAACGLTELLHGEVTTVTFGGINANDLDARWLFVIEAIDQTNERHQFHLLRTPVPGHTPELSMSMVHGEQRRRGRAGQILRMVSL